MMLIITRMLFGLLILLTTNLTFGLHWTTQVSVLACIFTDFTIRVTRYVTRVWVEKGSMREYEPWEIVMWRVLSILLWLEVRGDDPERAVRQTIHTGLRNLRLLALAALTWYVLVYSLDCLYFTNSCIWRIGTTVNFVFTLINALAVYHNNLEPTPVVVFVVLLSAAVAAAFIPFADYMGPRYPTPRRLW